MRCRRQLCALALSWLLFAACGPDPEGAQWVTVVDDLPGALLSVWGTSTTDVWVAGANSLDGQGPQVYHYDGLSWTRMDPVVSGGDLWWVFGFEEGPVFVGGENGIILRYEDGEVEKMSTPFTGVVYGIWGAGP